MRLPPPPRILAFACSVLLASSVAQTQDDAPPTTPWFRNAAEAAGRVMCMVPARVGSTRLALKNLRLLGERFMCEYALRAAALSGACDRVILNADFNSIEPVVNLVNAELRAAGHPHTEVEFYRRPPSLNGHRPADDVVADFMRSFTGGDVLLWVNPTSPLQIGQEVRAAAQFMADRPSLGAMIGAEPLSRHVVWHDTGEPLNFDPHTPGAKTQALRQIAVANYCVIGWRYERFLRAYESTGAAYFTPDVGWLPANKFQAVVVKTAADLHFASLIIAGSKQHVAEAGDSEDSDGSEMTTARARAWAYEDVSADVKAASTLVREQLRAAALAERQNRAAADGNDEPAK